MSVELDLVSLSAQTLLTISDNSILLLGLVSFVGLAIIVQRFNIGFAPAIAFSTFILGVLSLSLDTNTFGNVKLPFSIFNLLFILIVIGVAWMFAQIIYRQR